MCVCVYIFVCNMCVCIYIYMCVYGCVYMGMYICV